MTLEELIKINRLMLDLAKRYRPYATIWYKTNSWGHKFCYVCQKEFLESDSFHAIKDLKEKNLLIFI